MLCKFFEVSIHRLIVQGKDFLFLFNVSKNQTGSESTESKLQKIKPHKKGYKGFLTEFSPFFQTDI